DPNTGSATRNYVYTPPSPQRTDQFDIRLDHNLGSADRVFFKYSYDKSTSTTPGNLPPAGSAAPVGPYVSGGTYSLLSNMLATISYQFEDVLTVVRGSHTFKFGGNYIRHDFNGFTVRQPRGLFDFNGQFTRQIGAGGATTALADFALGAADAANRGILSGTFGMRFYN